MRAARRNCVCAGVAAFVALLAAQATSGEELKITSIPVGASLEIDGVPVGKTPYKMKCPGGYFHKPHTAFGARLEHAMVARFSMPGYVTQEIALTDGPLVWVAVNGKRQGNYFVFKSDHFNVELEPRVKVADTALGAPLDGRQNAGPLPYHPPEKAPEHGLDRVDARTANASSFAGASGVASSLTGAADAAHTGTVSITCDAPGAEIYVDGKFVGQAPATLRLASGPHYVEIKAAGKRGWSRDLEVMKDSQMSLHPVLEAGP
jgi:hypothetical protein